MSAMARELVEKARIGESADAVWRELGGEREKVMPRQAAMDPLPETAGCPTSDTLSGTIPTATAIAFGIPLPEPSALAKKRKKAALWPTASGTNAQLSLFD